MTTLTTIGYGDITPTTNAGRIFTIFIMISGVGLYSFFIGAVSGMILAANKHKDALKEKVKDLSDFMSYYEIPGRIRSEVFTFIKHMSEQRLSDNDARIISDLPTALQKDLKTYMCVRSIRSVRIFNDCSIDCLKAVGEKLHQICLSQGQVVIQQGDLGHEMYIIGHGKLSVRSESGDVLALLVDGQVFGEMALLEDETRSATVQADSYCDLYVLEKEDFLGIHQQFPEVQKNVREIIERRKQKSGSVS